jgi:ribosome-associated translation inhibitor RaiA
MKLQIRNHGVELHDEARNIFEEQIRLALGRFVRRVGLVRIYLRDANGPRGGPAYECRIVAELLPRNRVIVSGEGVSVTAALAGATSRIRLAVARQLKRRHERRRQSRRRLAATAA